MTSDTRSRISTVKQRLGIAATAFVASAVVAACSPPMTRTEATTSLDVLHVETAEYFGTSNDPLEAACLGWTLSAEQIESFFHLAIEYPESPYQEYYQVPCAIEGQLRIEGNVQLFALNAGGVATLTDESGKTRYFGCSAVACVPMLLAPPDGMAPD